MGNLSRSVALTVGIGGAALVAALLAGHAPAQAIAAFPVLVVLGVGAALWGGRAAVADVEDAVAYLEAPSGEKRPPGVTRELGSAVVAFRQRLEGDEASAAESLRAVEDHGVEDAEFLRLLSHELRTPLNTILGFTQVLIDGVDGPVSEDSRKDLEAIRSAGEHLRELSDDVIDLASLHATASGMSVADVSVRSVFAEVRTLMEGLVRGKDLRVVCDAPGDLVMRADPKRVKQVLVNLGSNAVKFTEQGEVRFAATVVDGGVRLSVSDTGPGLTPEEQALLFRNFAQVGPRAQRLRGSGLGLAICKRLVELHSGRIWVESTIGKGSTFIAEFPIEGAR